MSLQKFISNTFVTNPFIFLDGSAHPHFLIAGLGLAMLHGKEMKRQDALDIVTSTEANYSKGCKNNQLVRSVPKNRTQIKKELDYWR